MWIEKFDEENRSYVGTIETFSEVKSIESDNTPSDSKYRRWNLVIDAIYANDLPTGAYNPAQIDKAETAIFRSVSTYRKFHEYLDNEDEKLTRGQWVEIELGVKKSATPVWGLNTGRSAEQDIVLEKRIYIQHIKILNDDAPGKSVGAAAVANRTKSQVAQKHDLRTLQNRTHSSVGNLIQNVKTISSGCVHDVGQASFTTLNCDNDKTVFFDVGQPLWFQHFTMNKRSKSSLPRPTKKNGDFIILSHWDWDHYAFGRFDHAFHDVAWLAPDQIVGPSTYKFASQLNDAGKLHLIVGAVPSLARRSPLKLARDASNTADRNSSGFIAAIKLTDKRDILLTGDCDYATCHSLLPPTASFDRIVIPHHGGLGSGKMPKLKRSSEVFIISYGLNNKYGHPVERVLSAHAGCAKPIVGTAKNTTSKSSIRVPPYRQHLANRSRGDISL
tara:strand:+ start:12937 stop:14268 length:1332 start_codon:yes stop_codon:yes gene_type:complete